MLLALVEVKRDHIGEQLAAYIFMVLDQYYIKDFLSYFVMDYATANDCMVIFILSQLFEKRGLRYNF